MNETTPGCAVIALILFVIAVALLLSTDYFNRRRPAVFEQTGAVQAYIVKSGALWDVWLITYESGDQELVICGGIEYVCN